MREEWERYWKGKKAKISSNKKRMMKILDNYSNGKVLDAGCGTGFFSEYFSRNNLETFSLDYSKRALKMVRALDEKIIPISGDIRKLPFKDMTFDTIFSDGLLEHFKDPVSILNEFRRTLKTNGKIITFLPNRISYWIFVKPFVMKEIDEEKYDLVKIIKIHKNANLKIIKYGALGVFPFKASPEIFSKKIGRLLYVICEKG